MQDPEELPVNCTQKGSPQLEVELALMLTTGSGLTAIEMTAVTGALQLSLMVTV